MGLRPSENSYNADFRACGCFSGKRMACPIFLKESESQEALLSRCSCSDPTPASPFPMRPWFGCSGLTTGDTEWTPCHQFMSAGKEVKRDNVFLTCGIVERGKIAIGNNSK